MLSSYCLPTDHGISTRYSTGLNYALPLVRTNRGQTSINYSGPKAWSLVPNDLKHIAFKKPFSKKLKEYSLKVLSDINENKSQKKMGSAVWCHESRKCNKTDELRQIFESVDINETFYGFELDLENIFASDEEGATEFLWF